ncbi:hypothetical protein DKX38_022254 [Salix brachista]|uniref:Uncharacterized protein n=1 Tax=Salix brachista TaxID=2182728 RepID=A0A5N5K4U9_9ROSI|nr:hypothetical protein DKX38_022254 [Salix brachista]
MNGTATVALRGNSLFQFCNWKAEGLYFSRICYRVDSVKQKTAVTRSFEVGADKTATLESENGMRRDWLIRSDATGEVLVPATRSFSEHPHPFFHGSFGCSNKGVANVEHHLRDDEPTN